VPTLMRVVTKSFAGLVSCGALLCMNACSVGPNYKRPAANVPSTYRGALAPAAAAAESTPTPSHAATGGSASIPLGEEKWWDVFQDQELQGLIRTALKNNYDVRIAATRVLQAQAQLGITRADQLPSVSAGGNVTSVRNPKVGPIPGYENTQGQISASVSWNADFWGRYRRATEAARATLLANQWAQREVMASLVANVASSYFQLRELDLELEISKRTLASHQHSLDLTKTLE